MLEPVRLVTVHPALVHFTIGILAPVVVAYGGAAWLRAERWTFAGDLAVWLGGITSVGTLTFGFISNAVLAWPGGLETWRWIHLLLACVSTTGLLGLGTVRWVRRRTTPRSGWWTFVAALVLAASVSFTGWVGGEILVFHGGMGVKAAANGALSPPLHRGNATPANLFDGMAEVRSHWAAATTTVADMVVHDPSRSAFSSAATAASQLRTLTPAISQLGSDELHKGADFLSHSALLGTKSEDLARAASKEDLPAMAQALGDLTAVCAHCHDNHRW